MAHRARRAARPSAARRRLARLAPPGRSADSRPGPPEPSRRAIGPTRWRSWPTALDTARGSRTGQAAPTRQASIAAVSCSTSSRSTASRCRASVADSSRLVGDVRARRLEPGDLVFFTRCTRRVARRHCGRRRPVRPRTQRARARCASKLTARYWANAMSGARASAAADCSADPLRRRRCCAGAAMSRRRVLGAETAARRRSSLGVAARRAGRSRLDAHAARSRAPADRSATSV